MKLKSKKASVKILSLMLGVSLLAGCGNMIKKNQDATNAVVKKATQIQAKSKPKASSLVTFDDHYYFSDSPFVIEKKVIPLPKIFSKEYIYNTHEKQSFSSVIESISKQLKLNITVSEEAMKFLVGDKSNVQTKKEETKPIAQTYTPNGQQDNSKQVSLSGKLNNLKLQLNYQGTVEGLLNNIVNLYGIYWKYNLENNTVSIFHHETKTYELNSLIGTTQVKTTIGSTSSSDKDSTSRSETTYDSGKNHPWENAMSNIKNIIGNDGNVDSNPTLHTVTVITTPPVMAKVESYINKINNAAKTKIVTKVSIYDVTVGSSSNYGLNWDAIYKITSGSVSWNTTNIASAAASPFSSSAQTGTITGAIGSGPWAGTSLILSALQKTSKATYVTGATITSVNGKTQSSRSGSSIDYVKQVATTALGNTTGTSNNIEVTITPATLNTGNTITITPTVLQDNKILIDLYVDISRLVTMREQQVGSKDNKNTIDLPQTSHINFQETVPLRSGQTSVFAGLENTNNAIGTNSIGDKSKWYLGGNQATNHSKTITVVVVSAYIIEDQG